MNIKPVQSFLYQNFTTWPHGNGQIKLERVNTDFYSFITEYTTLYKQLLCCVEDLPFY